MLHPNRKDFIIFLKVFKTGAKAKKKGRNLNALTSRKKRTDFSFFSKRAIFKVSYFYFSFYCANFYLYSAINIMVNNSMKNNIYDCFQKFKLFFCSLFIFGLWRKFRLKKLLIILYLSSGEINHGTEKYH